MGAFSYIGPEIGQGVEEGIQRAHNLQDEQRQAKLQLAIGQWNNTTDPTQRQNIQAAIGSLYPTPAHGPQFLADLLHLKRNQQSGPVAAPAMNPTANSAAGVPTPQAPTDQLGVPYSGMAAAAPPSAPAAPSTPALNLGQIAQAPDAESAWKAIAQIPSATETATNRAQLGARNAQDLAAENNAARIQEALIRTTGNASMQKLNAAAQTLGADDFATAAPEIKMQALRSLATANRAPAWKTITDGNDVYAVDAHDPSKRQLIGRKSDLTQHLEYKTLTNPDGSQYLVPMVTWTKKGSTQPILQTQGDEQAGSETSTAPTSTTTPKGPSADLASANQNIAAANASSKKLNKGKPKSARTPSTVGSSAPLPTNLPKGAIPFGSKGSPLLKSDTQQYTKLAEDANAKDEALSAARSAAASPSPSSDQELIYSWVRSNVQGAGRMTQAEFNQAKQLGSLPMKAQNWLSMASTGKLTPEMRQMMLRDIERSAHSARSSADTLRTQIESEMNPSKQTAPTKSTPNPDLLNRLSQALEGR